MGGVRLCVCTCDDMHLFSGIKRKYVASTGVLRLCVCTCDDMHLFSDIKRKFVASTGVLRLLVGNRVGVGITRSTISSLLSSLFLVKVANN